MAKEPEIRPTTITITNFGGRLTRIRNGPMDSGFARFDTSFGYDPFTKPMNLTWLEQPSSIAGITGLLTGATPRNEGSTTIVYGVDHAGKAYRIQPNTVGTPNLDSILGIGSVTANSNTYQYGASIEFFGTPAQMFVGGDKGVNAVPVTSVVTGEFGGDGFIGNANNYVANTPHPLRAFSGGLVFGNGPTIGEISASKTVTSSIIGIAVGTSGSTQNIYSEINPPFPAGSFVHDLDVSQDYNYLLATVSDNAPEDLTTLNSDRLNASATFGDIFKWNGSDTGTTAGTAMPSQALSALQTYFAQTILFAQDTFGLSMGDPSRKLLSLQNNKAPLPGATGVNGNFIFWMAPEISSDGTNMYASMYYFGQLDQENPHGLYRVLRMTPAASSFFYNVPVNILVNNKYQTVNNAVTAIATQGLGKHYFSLLSANNSGSTYYFYRFLITPSGSGTPQAGVYETQTQLFSKRVGLSQIRVYVEPPSSGAGFQIDLIGANGSVINNGTFTYTYGDPISLNERINFNPSIVPTYSLGVRITNTGTTNMVIKKIELDLSPEGK